MSNYVCSYVFNLLYGVPELDSNIHKVITFKIMVTESYLSFFIVMLGIHCVICKSSYNISNIACLNSPLHHCLLSPLLPEPGHSKSLCSTLLLITTERLGIFLEGYFKEIYFYIIIILVTLDVVGMKKCLLNK
jgi:prepilin signal peptidase PulO-like enzyme (type II secretory pathway)